MRSKDKTPALDRASSAGAARASPGASPGVCPPPLSHRAGLTRSEKTAAGLGSLPPAPAVPWAPVGGRAGGRFRPAAPPRSPAAERAPEPRGAAPLAPSLRCQFWAPGGSRAAAAAPGPPRGAGRGVRGAGSGPRRHLPDLLCRCAAGSVSSGQRAVPVGTRQSEPSAYRQRSPRRSARCWALRMLLLHPPPLR